MKNGLGIEFVIRATDKRKRFKAPLIRTVMKVSEMTVEEYDAVSEIVQRHMNALNEEISAMVAAPEVGSAGPVGV